MAFGQIPVLLILALHLADSQLTPVFPPSPIKIACSSQDVSSPCTHLLSGQAWNSGNYAPAWVQIDLGGTFALNAISLGVNQTPDGFTKHVVVGGPFPDPRLNQIVANFTGETSMGDVLMQRLDIPTKVRYVRIITVRSTSWVSWNNVTLFAV
eukprot:TRINITY_DN1223_c0_g1_i3.p1 TRINITY_DN1223_c0_g1~~TRINITY_DN1223_c0_g1_i3.p1  ORF type:complete len:172 (-),score=9.28 TRINITY_DN1223_c0_g1_i3:88-546(-)